MFSLLLLATCLICGCGADSSTTRNNSFPVVVFSDVHFDPFFDPALFTALNSAPAYSGPRIEDNSLRW